MQLTIDLLPSSCWKMNLRTVYSPSNWNKIRKYVYKRANYRCEVCGGRGKNHPVECHEEWGFDDESKILHLNNLVALCPSCHRVKHFGRSVSVGLYKPTISHLMKVNKMNGMEAKVYIEEAFRVYKERDTYDWKVDLTPVGKLIGEILNTPQVYKPPTKK